MTALNLFNGLSSTIGEGGWQGVANKYNQTLTPQQHQMNMKNAQFLQNGQIHQDSMKMNQQLLDQQKSQNAWGNTMGIAGLGLNAIGAIAGYRQGGKQLRLGREQLEFDKKNATTNVWNQATTLRDQMTRRAEFGAYDNDAQRNAAIKRQEAKAANIRDMGDPDKM